MSLTCFALHDTPQRITHGISEGKIAAMTRSDLIAALASRFPNLMTKDADISVKEIIDAVTQALANGDRVEIRGFGSFALNYRPPRTGRNPKTGEKVQVPEKHVPHFKAGKEMRDRVEQSVKPPPLQRAA
jgi:integration host factor subunit beta